MPPALPRNDMRQYDALAGEWWRDGGAFAMLRWIAAARAALIPPTARPGAVLVDLACGGGLLAPYLATLGYRHLGIHRGVSALRLAREHGGQPVRADVAEGPF